jgi:hypothetical protein
MCSSGCPTQDHASYGECLRSKTARVAYANSVNGWDASKQKRWDGELSRYRDLVSQGLEPKGTTHREMDRAEKQAEVSG